MKIKLTISLFLLLSLLVNGCTSADNLPAESTTGPDIIASESVPATALSETAAWYLDLQTGWPLETESVPAELSGYSVKVPLQCSATIDNIIFTIDFFQEYYPLGEFIQLRITAVNNTGSDIEYHGNSNYGTGYFYCYNKPEATYSMIGINANQGAYFAMDAVALETLKAGETTTYERLTRADPDFFKPGGSYSFFFGICDFFGTGNRIIEIPVEVVRLN